jgi:glycosyltransferase involved in cell wall biosynthesis
MCDKTDQQAAQGWGTKIQFSLGHIKPRMRFLRRLARWSRHLRAKWRQALGAALRDVATRGQFQQQARTIDALRWQLEQQGQITEALNDLLASAPVLASSQWNEAHDGPLVSVIMPTWNRAGHLATAINSVRRQSYPYWELLVIDDGSTDSTPALLAAFVADPRIRYLPQARAGCAAARNRGLAESKGEIIAYLDSDNFWYPDYLQAVVAALEAGAHDCVYLDQLVKDTREGRLQLRGRPFDPQVLRESNFIDLNVFAHRAALARRCGGFDTNLQRLIDWDLILRMSAESSPVRVAALGGCYQGGAWDRISNEESLARACYQVRRKHEKQLESPLRVLYLLHSYPQLSETYVRTEIEYMRRRGVHVEVWSWHPPMRPYPSTVPVHRGSLAEALERCRPDILHVHWLCIGKDALPLAQRAGVPVTYRGHGFEFGEPLARELQEHPAVRRLYLFPHMAARLPSPAKVWPLPVAFNPDRFYPPARKDRRLVVRTGLAKSAKDPMTFLKAARLCPDHRFVLAVCTPTGREKAAEEILALRDQLASPAEVLVDLTNEQAAELVRSAGIYFHTYSYEEPLGMPISIAEALGTGAYVLARKGPDINDYLGPNGACYETCEQAAQLVAETLHWPEKRWQAVSLAAVDYAYTRFADSTVLEAVLEQWRRLARERSDESRIAA